MVAAGYNDPNNPEVWAYGNDVTGWDSAAVNYFFPVSTSSACSGNVAIVIDLENQVAWGFSGTLGTWASEGLGGSFNPASTDEVLVDENVGLLVDYSDNEAVAFSAVSGTWHTKSISNYDPDTTSVSLVDNNVALVVDFENDAIHGFRTDGSLSGTGLWGTQAVSGLSNDSSARWGTGDNVAMLVDQDTDTAYGWTGLPSSLNWKTQSVSFEYSNDDLLVERDFGVVFDHGGNTAYAFSYSNNAWESGGESISWLDKTVHFGFGPSVCVIVDAYSGGSKHVYAYAESNNAWSLNSSFSSDLDISVDAAYPEVDTLP